MTMLKTVLIISVLFFNTLICTAENVVSIVIIGSGSSGIAAASKLLKNNFTNIKILEAEDRIGGRINSVKFGDAFVDLGAEYCHGEQDNIVYSMVKDLNILKPSPTRFDIFYSNGELLDPEIQNQLFEFAHSIKHRDEGNSSEETDICQGMLSIGACLDINLKKMIAEIENPVESEIFRQAHRWLRNYKSSTDSCLDLNDLSLISHFKECDGDKMLQWNGLGYKTILDVMMQTHLHPENQLLMNHQIILKKEVTRIHNWDNGTEIDIICKDGDTFTADHVIFTPSVGVLKSDHEMLFNPKLPLDKVCAIEKIGFGAIIKVALYFSKKWWTETVSWSCIWKPNDEHHFQQNQIDWLRYFTFFAHAPNNPNVLVAWFAGEAVPIIENLSDQTLFQGFKFILDNCFNEYNATMPNKMLRSSWHKNTHFRGTYSYESAKGYASGGRKLPETLASPLLNENGKPTLLFAGEATHPSHYSTVHGAIETGFREADRIINYYKSNA